MEWCKFYANLPDLPRVQAADDAAPGAFKLLMQAMAYLTRAESGGFIPDTQVPYFGPRWKARVAALVAEGLWIREERGYRVDPEIWSEERNLNDSAERKKEADRKRVAAKRAAEKAAREAAAREAGDASRDSRATCRATPGRDSRTVEKKREEKTSPPNPPKRRRRPTAPPGPPLLNLAATPRTGEGEESSDHEDQATAELVAAVRAARPDWSTAAIRKALADDRVRDRPWPLIREAALTVARDPLSQHPGRLAHDGPWWYQKPATAAGPPRPDHCGRCDSDTRLTLEDRPRRCPVCHPLRAEAS
jgi:hypothetical protein